MYRVTYVLAAGNVGRFLATVSVLAEVRESGYCIRQTRNQGKSQHLRLCLFESDSKKWATGPLQAVSRETVLGGALGD